MTTRKTVHTQQNTTCMRLLHMNLLQIRMCTPQNMQTDISKRTFKINQKHNFLHKRTRAPYNMQCKRTSTPKTHEIQQQDDHAQDIRPIQDQNGQSRVNSSTIPVGRKTTSQSRKRSRKPTTPIAKHCLFTNANNSLHENEDICWSMLHLQECANNATQIATNVCWNQNANKAHGKLWRRR